MRKKKRIDYNGKPILLSDDERMGVSVHGVKRWTAPPDMSDAMVKRVLKGKCCGGKLRGGGYCKSKLVVYADHRPPPYRCLEHGGSPSGGKKGKQVNLSHGIYTECMLEEEKELYDQLNIDSVDEEIKLTKLRLRRALKADKLRDSSYMITTEEDLIKKNGKWEVVGKKISTDDGYARVIHGITNQLVKLTSLRMDLIEAGRELITGAVSKIVIYLPDNKRRKKR